MRRGETWEQDKAFWAIRKNKSAAAMQDGSARLTRIVRALV
jgi:hypothetical protein